MRPQPLSSWPGKKVVRKRHTPEAFATDIPAKRDRSGSPRMRPRFADLAKRHKLEFDRLEIHTGTANPATIASLTRYVSGIIEAEDIETLREIRAGGMATLKRLFDLKKSGKSAPPIHDANELRASFVAWLESGLRAKRSGLVMAPSTLKRYKGALTGMLAHWASLDSKQPAATIRQTVDVLEAYGKHCEAKALWRNYGNVRASLIR